MKPSSPFLELLSPSSHGGDGRSDRLGPATAGGHQNGFRGTAMAQVPYPRSRRGHQAGQPRAGTRRSGEPARNSPVRRTRTFRSSRTSASTSSIADGFDDGMGQPRARLYLLSQHRELPTTVSIQKKVARRMLQMTQLINSSWKENHVGGAGVLTCYTCHRGQPVPANIWFTIRVRTAGRVHRPQYNGRTWRRRQLVLHRCLRYAHRVSRRTRTSTTTRLGQRDDGAADHQGQADTGRRETPYGLMIHMSEGLGVNCTFATTHGPSRTGLRAPHSGPRLARYPDWYGTSRQLSRAAAVLLPAEPPRCSGRRSKVNCTTMPQRSQPSRFERGTRGRGLSGTCEVHRNRQCRPIPRHRRPLPDAAGRSAVISLKSEIKENAAEVSPAAFSSAMV